MGGEAGGRGVLHPTAVLNSHPDFLEGRFHQGGLPFLFEVEIEIETKKYQLKDFLAK